MPEPVGVHGVFCNGVEVFDGTHYVTNGRSPGQVLDRFAPSSAFRGSEGWRAAREACAVSGPEPPAARERGFD